jgi:hypothetical protein
MARGVIPPSAPCLLFMQQNPFVFSLGLQVLPVIRANKLFVVCIRSGAVCNHAQECHSLHGQAARKKRFFPIKFFVTVLRNRENLPGYQYSRSVL